MLKSNEIYSSTFLALQNKIQSNYFKINNYNSTFGPLRYDSVSTLEKDSILYSYQFGYENAFKDINRLGKGMSFGGTIFFDDKLYCFLNARIVSNPYLFPNFSGISRDIKRYGFNSGETDLAGIGYQNGDYIIQIGRGRQSWGAGNDIQLALSESSAPYDYFMYQVNKKKINARYFHGYLERVEGFNRYINGRGIEFSDNNGLTVGFSEIVVYSGLNRSVDISYLILFLLI